MARGLFRCARLRTPAWLILTASGEGRALAHVAWLALAGAALLTPEAGSLGWWSLPTLALFCGLALIALFDARYLIIPDGPLLVLLLSGLALLPWLEAREIVDRLAAAICGFATLRIAEFAYERLRGHAGLGSADARLFGLAGLWLGLAALPGCLLAACASALLSALIATRGRLRSHALGPMPFGPHLALGFWLTWVLGPFEAG